jgi:hypothetical protein
MSNPFLLFIAYFVRIGVAQEASLALMRTALGGISVRRAMMTKFHLLRSTDSLQQAIDLILATAQQDFPVLDGAKAVGILLATT